VRAAARRDLEPAREGDAEPGARRGQHRQRPDLDGGVPLELGALDGPRGRGAPVPARPRRRPEAAVRDGVRRPAADRDQCDRRGAEPEPARRARRPAPQLQRRRWEPVMGKLLKNKLVLIPLVALLVLGVAYKVALAPKPKAAPKKIDGALV